MNMNFFNRPKVFVKNSISTGVSTEKKLLILVVNFRNTVNAFAKFKSLLRYSSNNVQITC